MSVEVKEENICRICFKVADEFELIDGGITEMFDVLMLATDLDESKDRIICSNCLETVKKCFSFKSVCMETEKFILPFDTEENHGDLDLKHIIYRKGCEDSNVCRFCLHPLETSNFVPLDDLLKDELLPAYMPEMDFNIVKNPVVCESCRKNINYYLTFMQKYFGSDGKISICQDEMTNSTDGIIGGPSNEPIKAEEPLEVYSQSCQDEPDKLDDIYDEPTKMKEVLDGPKMYRCTTCTYVTKRRRDLPRHMVIHQDPSEMVMHKCTLCLFETKHGNNLRKHIMVRHKNSSEVKINKCELCNFETSNRKYLWTHSLTHKDLAQVLFKCTTCGYETKVKSRMKHHMLVHKNPSEIEMYECYHCAYKTKYKRNLGNHILTHKDPSEIHNMFKCKICTFQTKYKSRIKSHTQHHKDHLKMKMHKCTICSYESKYESFVKRHSRVHKKNSEVVMHKCDLCPYEARRKGNVRIHMKVHENPPRLETYKCAECPLETKYKSSLRKHMLTHKAKSHPKSDSGTKSKTIRKKGTTSI